MCFAPADMLAVAPAPAGTGVGWRAFTEPSFIVEASVVLLLAVTLAATIAYHPIVRRKATTLEEFQAPKTHLTYAMIGAVVAIIVSIQPSMALVVFGIGGLMRFRTQVGEAKDTGRLILVTVVGLCCGLQLFVVALLTTALGWGLIFALERSTVQGVTIQGVESGRLQEAAEAYAGVLGDHQWVVLGQRKNAKKGAIAFVVRAPAGADRDAVQAAMGQLDPGLRGAIDWGSG